QLDARTGIREALPAVFGYIGIGIAFGIVGQAAGFCPLIVSAMSFFIFAGSAQFVTVSMFTGGSAILSIMLPSFLVYTRMILMG
ncbi:AzlC family ABC transporter permease, partial [Enterococcus faecalis]|uniref:AzlC family ABC transporter permease n=1 Tax=Enterococcus faecalis TaxID=1351 RepID=UPI003D6C33D4